MRPFKDCHNAELHQILLNIKGEIFLASPPRRRELEEQVREINAILESRTK